MAQQVIVKLVDDIDGSDADETVKFELEGREYEIDLSEANAEALRTALDAYVQVARRIRGRNTRAPRRTTAPPKHVATPPDPRAVRAWASGQPGLELNPRGRVPQRVIDAFVAANP